MIDVYKRQWLFMWIVSEVRERRKTIYDRSIDKTKCAKMLIYDLIIAIYELSQAALDVYKRQVRTRLRKTSIRWVLLLI